MFSFVEVAICSIHGSLLIMRFVELAICGNMFISASDYVRLYSIYFWLDVNLGMAESSAPKGPGKNKRGWTSNEDEKLIDALELHVSGKYSGCL